MALLVGHQTCNVQVTGSTPSWVPLRIGLDKPLTLCASVTKQYNLVPAKGSDLFGWESNRSSGGK